MSTIKEIKSAISKLSKSDLSAFRAWFEEFDAKIWDKQIEKDVTSGKLDEVVRPAIADFKAGKCKEL
ncbi:MAG: hypothetical protein V3U40_07085 [Candidatus Scalindua sediminis]